MRLQRGVHRLHRRGVALGADQPGADLGLVGAHLEDRIVELARDHQRLPGAACGFDRGDVARKPTLRRLHDPGRDAPGAVDRDRDVAVAQRVGLDRLGQRRQRDAARAGRAVAGGGELLRALLHLGRELRGLGDLVDQPPVLGLLPAHALGRGAEDVGQVVADLALVGHARQPAGAGQHAQQRHLGQADRAAAVVDEDDLVAGQRQLVAAAGAGAVDRGEKLQPRVRAGILQPVARLVGELAEVDLPSVAADAEHEDVGARAEDLVLGAGDDHRAHLGVLEADPVDGVVQLDVDPEVVAVELELVAWSQAAVLVEVGGQGRHWALEAQLPVAVAAGVGLVVDAVGGRGGGHRQSPVGSSKCTLMHLMLCTILHCQSRVKQWRIPAPTSAGPARGAPAAAARRRSAAAAARWCRA